MPDEQTQPRLLPLSEEDFAQMQDKLRDAMRAALVDALDDIARNGRTGTGSEPTAGIPQLITLLETKFTELNNRLTDIEAALDAIGRAP